MMGAGIREGYWQPEDYKDYGEKHIEERQIENEGSVITID
jgi:hypothetical protein